jgi:hypothetical protein
MTPFNNRIVLIALSSSKSSFAVSVESTVIVLHRCARCSTECIDPTIGDGNRLTQASLSYASTYTLLYALSYLSTSTYQSTAAAGGAARTTEEECRLHACAIPTMPILGLGSRLRWRTFHHANIGEGLGMLPPVLARQLPPFYGG